MNSGLVWTRPTEGKEASSIIFIASERRQKRCRPINQHAEAEAPLSVKVLSSAQNKLKPQTI